MQAHTQNPNGPAFSVTPARPTRPRPRWSAQSSAAECPAGTRPVPAWSACPGDPARPPAAHDNPQRLASPETLPAAQAWKARASLATLPRALAPLDCSRRFKARRSRAASQSVSRGEAFDITPSRLRAARRDPRGPRLLGELRDAALAFPHSAPPTHPLAARPGRAACPRPLAPRTDPEARAGGSLLLTSQSATARRVPRSRVERRGPPCPGPRPGAFRAKAMPGSAISTAWKSKGEEARGYKILKKRDGARRRAEKRSGAGQFQKPRRRASQRTKRRRERNRAVPNRPANAEPNRRPTSGAAKVRPERNPASQPPARVCQRSRRKQEQNEESKREQATKANNV